MPAEFDAADYYQEQESMIKSKLPEGFKIWFNSSMVAEKRKEYVKMLGKEGLFRTNHMTSDVKTKFNINGDTKPGRYEAWHLDFKSLLKGRQAISQELRGASPLSGHQH